MSVLISVHHVSSGSAYRRYCSSAHVNRRDLGAPHSTMIVMSDFMCVFAVVVFYR